MRKRLKEHGGHTDLSHMNPVQNHKTPNQRSRSLVVRSTSSSSPSVAEKHSHHPTPMSALLSSALDTAIASSSSQIVDSLHKMDGDSVDSGRRGGDPYSRDTRGGPADYRDNRIYGPGSHGGGGAGSDHRDYRDRDSRDPYRSRDYHDEGRPPSDYHHHNSTHARTNGESERSRHIEPRYSTLPNSITVSDHFDQYRTLRDDSGLGRDLESPTNQPQPIRTGAQSDRSPDSGLSDTDDFRFKTRPLQRRKTLPSIMKGVPPSPTIMPNPATAHTKPASKTMTLPSAKTTDTISGPHDPERYIIENGIRKRVRAEVYARPTKPADPLNRPKELPSRYKLETHSRLKGSNRGSLPDVSACVQMKQDVMPREEVSKLSEKRREELRLLNEEEERRRQQEIVLRLTDLKVGIISSWNLENGISANNHRLGVYHSYLIGLV